MGTSLFKDKIFLKNFLNNGKMHYLVMLKNPLIILGLDPEAYDFQNLTSSSLSTSLSVVKLS